MFIEEQQWGANIFHGSTIVFILISTHSGSNNHQLNSSSMQLNSTQRRQSFTKLRWVHTYWHNDLQLWSTTVGGANPQHLLDISCRERPANPGTVMSSDCIPMLCFHDSMVIPAFIRYLQSNVAQCTTLSKPRPQCIIPHMIQGIWAREDHSLTMLIIDSQRGEGYGNNWIAK